MWRCALQCEAGGLAKGGERILNRLKLSLAKVRASAARKFHTRLVLIKISQYSIGGRTVVRPTHVSGGEAGGVRRLSLGN